MRMSSKHRQYGRSDVTFEVATALFDFFGGSSSRDHRDYLISTDPNSHSELEVFRRKWACVSLLSKYPGLDLGVDRKKVAIEKFLQAESACLATNIRILQPSPMWGVDAVISTARRKIAELLGDLDLNVLERWMSFSNGATTRLRRVDAAAPNKYSARPNKKLHVTSKCLPYAIAAVGSSPLWRQLVVAQTGSEDPFDWFEVVEGNKVETVPKNAKTDRIIAKEPCMNIYVQKGFGGYIRRQLRRVGVDLDSQVRNQEMARIGSITGLIATIDLSAASDTIALELVRLLLPDDWFRFVCETRSPMGRLPDGRFISYQKVSSMGNGFTFELESLLFWALARSTLEVFNHSDRRLAVYGDDITITVSAVEDLKNVFEYCGFTVNDEKSFYIGYFRESCGKHYFNGVDVTPIYLRKPIDNVYRQYWLVNSFRRWCTRDTGVGCDHSYAVWKRLVRTIPKRLRKYIPEGIGDGGILATLSEAKPRYVGSTYQGVHMVASSYQHDPGQYLTYLHNRNVMKDAGGDPDTESREANGKKTDVSLLTKVVPDRYKWSRYRRAVWHDPGYFYTGT